MSSIRAKAPGKLIISGEHSVLKNCPAIAMAVDLFATTTISSHTPASVLFDLFNLGYKNSEPFSALRTLKNRIKNEYHGFLTGNHSIRNVIKKPFELLQYTATNLLEAVKPTLDKGVRIHNKSEIPTGCGLGSSAAIIVSTNYGLAKFFNLNISDQQAKDLALEAENLQHGNSSGLDIHLSMYGGCVFLADGNFHARPLSNLPLQIIQTGRPTASTGDCVSHSQKLLAANLCEKFQKTTEQIDQALTTNDKKLLTKSIRANHRLLCQLEVVPKKVQNFVKQIEQLDCAAKICGAGSISGDNAGVILVAGDVDISKILGQYQYTKLTAKPEADGARAVTV